MSPERLSDLIKYRPEALWLLDEVVKRIRDNVITEAKQQCYKDNRSTVTRLDMHKAIEQVIGRKFLKESDLD